MNKSALIESIIAKLQADFSLSLEAARAAAAGATDEQNKSESKYDTRGLELSYLAAGQGKQIAETEATLEYFHHMAARPFIPGSLTDLGALIQLEAAGQRAEDQPLYFLALRGGGVEVQHEGREVLVITPKSPLGQQLMGRQPGDRFEFGRPATKYRVVRVF